MNRQGFASSAVKPRPERFADGVAQVRHGDHERFDRGEVQVAALSRALASSLAASCVHDRKVSRVTGADW
jgi:hypothetical protein